MNYKFSLINVLVLFLIVASCTQINKSSDSLKVSAVNFMSIAEGRIAILDETYEPYFSQLQAREVHTFTGFKPPSDDINEVRSFAREKFSEAVMAFSDDEKECILYVINEIQLIFKSHKINLVANHPWKFIKIENWLCGGFAHTRGNSIILSQKHLEKLMTNWSPKMTSLDKEKLVAGFGALLVHEQFHSLQRSYKSKFDALYSDFWDFKQVKVEPNQAIAIHQVSNPDAPNPEWAFVQNENYYWIRTLIKKNIENPIMGKDFIDCVYPLKKENEKFFVRENSLGVPISLRLSQFEGYVNRFPVSNGLDHPNEISAYMFSQYFVSLLFGNYLHQ